MKVKTIDLKPSALSLSEAKRRYSKELAKGTDHEMEHTNNRSVAQFLALPHIAENKNYYTKLEQCMDKKSVDLGPARLANTIRARFHPYNTLDSLYDYDLSKLWVDAVRSKDPKAYKTYYKAVLDKKDKGIGSGYSGAALRGATDNGIRGLLAGALVGGLVNGGEGALAGAGVGGGLGAGVGALGGLLTQAWAKYTEPDKKDQAKLLDRVIAQEQKHPFMWAMPHGQYATGLIS